ncbi:MAG TPA: efflux RND transporter periplasmic adaptor subunit [Xanthobacteraceae bacterium]
MVIHPRLVLIAVLAIAGGGAASWYLLQGPEPVSAARPAARAAVPVSVAAAARRDMPIYLNGLGTVQALYTIGIHSQVDGKLTDVLFTEGQHVKKDDVLAKIDPRLYQAALDQAKARRAQDAAQLGAAQKDLERTKTLVLRSFETQQNVDQQQAKVDQFKASLAADDAAIETAQTQLDYTTILAPSDGRIGVRQVDPGNLVRASDPGSIAQLTRTKPIAVMFTLPARALDDVRDAMARGTVEVTAFDQDNRRALSTGTLLLIDNQIDQATATIRLKALFANDDEKLWPGEFVNARLLIETRSNALTVPSTAVQRGPQGLFAWVVNDKNIASTRNIELGATTGNQTIVVSGLSDGDRVVTDGHYKLQQNVPVTITAPAPIRSGSTS